MPTVNIMTSALLPAPSTTSPTNSAGSQSSGDVCRICFEPEDPSRPLLRNLCGCSSALAHLKCIETWIHYKQASSSMTTPICEVCVKPFRLPRPLAPPSATLAARLRADTERQQFLQTQVWTTLLDMRFPMVVAVLCGYCGDMFATFTRTGATELSLLCNLTLVFLWFICVVPPNSPTWRYRVADRCSVLKELAALMWIYFTYYFFWAMSCLTLPHIAGFSRTQIMHHINILCLSGTILLRLVRASCHPRPAPLAAPPPPPPPDAA